MQANPHLLRDVAAVVADQLPPRTEALAGLELGGVPLASAIALHTGLPWALIRRSRREDPAGPRLAGTPVRGRLTVLIKDMARTGAALTSAATCVRDCGAIVTHAAVAISWNPELPELLKPVGITPITALTLLDLRQAWQPCGRTHSNPEGR